MAAGSRSRHRFVLRADSLEEGGMKTVSRHVVRHAQALAREIDARAVLVLADAVEGDDELRQLVRTVSFRTILISRVQDIPPDMLPPLPHCEWITVPDVHMTRTGQVKVALLVCLAKGLLQRGDRVVCLTGIDGSSVIDTLIVLNLGSEPELFSATQTVNLGGDVTPAVFERTLALVTQLAVEGREGRPVGAIFVVGDSEKVLAQSRLLVLNPFQGYPESERNILDAEMEETIKEFSAIDGAFIVRGDGVVLTAGSQLLPSVAAPQLPKGLGTRHAAAAAITASTDAVAIAISQSTGTVSVFKSGQMITDIHKPSNGGRLAI
jgi:diadenylate cyclase